MIWKLCMIKEIFNGLLPNQCVSCFCNVREPAKLCRTCLNDIELLDIKRSPNLLLRHDIARLIKRPQFDSLFAATWYQPPIDNWLKQFKFNRQWSHQQALRQVLKRQLKKARQSPHWHEPELCVPVPLHWFREFKRSYNQSELLWQSLNLPIDTKVITRTRSTRAQSELNKRQRSQNIRGAFHCELTKPYQHIALLDDVITTGATVNELARLLKSTGVKQVSVWTFAITDK